MPLLVVGAAPEQAPAVTLKVVAVTEVVPPDPV